MEDTVIVTKNDMAKANTTRVGSFCKVNEFRIRRVVTIFSKTKKEDNSDDNTARKMLALLIR